MKTNNSKKIKASSLVSILILVIGVLLMVFKIVVDSEPGAIPLLLIVIGAGWFFASKFQLRSQAK
jgi:positive regulator of sigma E activity